MRSLFKNCKFLKNFHFFIIELQLNLSEDIFENFYDFFDKSRDNRIDIREFVDILKPALEKAALIS